MSLQFAVLGNPENRRVRMFVEAVRAKGLPFPIVLPWSSYISGSLDLASSLPPGTHLRIESPGENQMVDLLLLYEEGLHLRRDDIGWGEIRHGQTWFAGFSRVLARLEKELQALSLGGIYNPPASIRLMFDKWACQDQLAAAGIPQPHRLGEIGSLAQLRALMAETGRIQVFLKPFYGSSASGVIAFRQAGDRMTATTSVEMQGTAAHLRLFNSLRVRTYTDRERIAQLIQRLAQDRLLVQEWIPKASLDEATIDLRVVVLFGKARHLVVRSSQSPLTNLHLGNARGDSEAFRAAVGDARWKEVHQLAEAAVAALPGTAYAGVDIALSSGFAKAYVIEVNAFGDLLPRVHHEGETTYEAFVNAICVRHQAQEA